MSSDRLKSTSKMIGASSSREIIFADTVEDITLACDFEHPLESEDQRYQDFAASRGDNVLKVIRKRFARNPAGQFRHVVFSSHRGSGKTTELYRIARDLSAEYHCMYFEANVEMNPFSIDGEDLLLALAQSIELHMRELGLPIPGERLERVQRWFSEVVQSTEWNKNFSAELSAGVEVAAEVPLFAKLFGSFKSLIKVDSTHKAEVKQVLRRYPGALLDSVNLLLDAAQQELDEADRGRLLIIIDNLDRYEPKVIDELLIKGADRIRALHTNLILTPPISLVYRPQSEQIQTYFQCETMTMIRLRRPDQKFSEFDGPGRDEMLAALRLRLDLAALMPDVEAQNRVVSASGGSIRQLIELVSEASLVADAAILTLEDVESAARRTRARLRDLINANGWIPALVSIHRTKQISHDTQCLDVLYHRLAFKYNGEGWYDIHPLVFELEEFRHELERE